MFPAGWLACPSGRLTTPTCTCHLHPTPPPPMHHPPTTTTTRSVDGPGVLHEMVTVRGVRCFSTLHVITAVDHDVELVRQTFVCLLWVCGW